MNELEQYQYSEMIRQSRNSAIYHMLFAKKVGGEGTGGSEPPVPPEPPAQLSTYMRFDDGTDQWFDFSGRISQKTMIDAGLLSENYDHWIKNIVEVNIGSQVTWINSYTFWKCNSLSNLTIGNNVTRIGQNAFRKCNLLSVFIPDKLTTIESWAFIECNLLSSFVVSPNNNKFSSENGLLLADNGTTLYSVPVGLTDVTIPNHITNIDSNAFTYCEYLSSIIIPNSVSSIGSQAFGSCISLTSINIPDSVLIIENNAFTECENLISVTIGSNVETIEYDIFAACYSLSSVEFKGKSKETVQGMEWYPWEIQSGCTISGTDPDTGESWQIVIE